MLYTHTSAVAHRRDQFFLKIIGSVISNAEYKRVLKKKKNEIQRVFNFIIPRILLPRHFPLLATRSIHVLFCHVRGRVVSPRARVLGIFFLVIFLLFFGSARAHDVDVISPTASVKFRVHGPPVTDSVNGHCPQYYSRRGRHRYVVARRE